MKCSCKVSANVFQRVSFENRKLVCLPLRAFVLRFTQKLLLCRKHFHLFRLDNSTSYIYILDICWFFVALCCCCFRASPN